MVEAPTRSRRLAPGAVGARHRHRYRHRLCHRGPPARAAVPPRRARLRGEAHAPRRRWARQKGKDAAPLPSLSDPVIADATQRLASEFAGRVCAVTIAAIVHRSRLDLDSSPPAALPELTERLARQRLHDRLPQSRTLPATSARLSAGEDAPGVRGHLEGIARGGG